MEVTHTRNITMLRVFPQPIHALLYHNCRHCLKIKRIKRSATDSLRTFMSRSLNRWTKYLTSRHPKILLVGFRYYINAIHSSEVITNESLSVYSLSLTVVKWENMRKRERVEVSIQSVATLCVYVTVTNELLSHTFLPVILWFPSDIIMFL